MVVSQTSNLEIAEINGVQRARDRGIFAVRRHISTDSQETLQAIADELQPEIRNAGRLFDVTMIGVTIIGFSRFDMRHRDNGPTTRTVVGEVPSSIHTLEVRLGSLGVYGSQTKGKLAIDLEGDAITNEISGFEDKFRVAGFPLLKDPNSDEKFVPHCSVALIYADNLAYFHDPTTLRRLEEITGLGQDSTQVIGLDPINPP